MSEYCRLIEDARGQNLHYLGEESKILGSEFVLPGREAQILGVVYSCGGRVSVCSNLAKKMHI
jgi:hypothetical protein